jgi:hypothetical protein
VGAKRDDLAQARGDDGQPPLVGARSGARTTP